MRKAMKLSLQGGKVLAIYSDDLADLKAKAKTATIRRVSYVEPTPDGQWAADMSPVAPGVVLGPYRLRQEALDAEIRFLDSKLFT
jgi:hypothetical protein